MAKTISTPNQNKNDGIGMFMNGKPLESAMVNSKYVYKLFKRYPRIIYNLKNRDSASSVSKDISITGDKLFYNYLTASQFSKLYPESIFSTYIQSNKPEDMYEMSYTITQSDTLSTGDTVDINVAYRNSNSYYKELVFLDYDDSIIARYNIVYNKSISGSGYNIFNVVPSGTPDSNNWYIYDSSSDTYYQDISNDTILSDWTVCVKKKYSSPCTINLYDVDLNLVDHRTFNINEYTYIKDTGLTLDKLTNKYYEYSIWNGWMDENRSRVYSGNDILSKSMFDENGELNLYATYSGSITATIHYKMYMNVTNSFQNFTRTMTTYGSKIIPCKLSEFFDSDVMPGIDEKYMYYSDSSEKYQSEDIDNPLWRLGSATGEFINNPVDYTVKYAFSMHANLIRVGTYNFNIAITDNYDIINYYPAGSYEAVDGTPVTADISPLYGEVDSQYDMWSTRKSTSGTTYYPITDKQFNPMGGTKELYNKQGVTEFDSDRTDSGNIIITNSNGLNTFDTSKLISQVSVNSAITTSYNAYGKFLHKSTGNVTPTVMSFTVNNNTRSIIKAEFKAFTSMEDIGYFVVDKNVLLRYNKNIPGQMPTDYHELVYSYGNKFYNTTVGLDSTLLIYPGELIYLNIYFDSIVVRPSSNYPDEYECTFGLSKLRFYI